MLGILLHNRNGWLGLMSLWNCFRACWVCITGAASVSYEYSSHFYTMFICVLFCFWVQGENQFTVLEKLNKLVDLLKQNLKKM